MLVWTINVAVALVVVFVFVVVVVVVVVLGGGAVVMGLAHRIRTSCDVAAS